MKILKILLITMMLFTQPFKAATSEECGVKYENGIEIEERSFELCEKDVSLSVLTILFHNLTLDEELEYFFGSDKPAKNVELMAQSSDVNGKLFGMFSALSNIFWWFVMFALFAKTTNLFMSIMKSGAALNGKGLDNKKIASSTAGLLLLAPVAGVNFATLIVIKTAFAACMIANYFFSTMLSYELIKTTKVDVDQGIQWKEADAQANELIKVNLTIDRTRQQLLNQNFSVASNFNDDFEDEDSGMDFSDFAEKIQECMSPYMKQSGDTYYIESPQKNYCLEEFSTGTTGGVWDSLAGSVAGHLNDERSYGNPHVISSIKYTQPNYAQMFHDQDGTLNNISQVLTGEDDVEGTAADLVDKYQTDIYFKRFIQANEILFNELLDANEKDFPQIEKSVIQILDTQANEFAESLLVDIGNSDEISNKNSIFKAKAIFAKMLAVYNSLNGFNDNGDGDQFRLDGNEDKKYGIQYLLDQAKKSSDSIQEAHCAKRFLDLKLSQQTQIAMTNLQIDPSNEDLTEKVLFNQIPARNFECIDINGREYGNTSSSEDYTFLYDIDSNEIDRLTMFDLEEETDRELFGFNDTYTTFEAKQFSSKEEKRLHRAKLNQKLDQHYIDKRREAIKHKLLLKAYFFYVKRAAIKTLGEAFKDNSDTEGLIEFRQMGWATAGGFLIKMSFSQGNAGRAANDIMNSVTFNSFTNDRTYVNEKAMLSINAENKEEDREQSEFEVKLLTEFLDNGTLNAGQKTYNKSPIPDSPQQQEDDNHNYVMVWFDQLLFSSFDYVKQSNGFDVHKTMMQGIEACKNGTGACKGDISAMAGYMQTGNALIERTFQFYMIQAVINMANNAVNAGDDSGDSFKGLAKLFGGAFTIIKIILGFVLQAMTVFINTISVVFPFMLAVGFFCSYILPSIPFIAFSMAVLSWLILILTTIIVFQVQIARALIADTDSENAFSFKFFWDILAGILLKPSLMIFSVAIVFVMWEIIPYFINSVYGFFAGSTRTEGAILGMFMEFVLQMFYLVIVSFSLMWASLKLPAMVDEMFEQLGLKVSGDSQAIAPITTFFQAHAQNTVSSKLSEGAQKGVRKAHNTTNNYFTEIRKVEKDKAEANQVEEPKNDVQQSSNSNDLGNLKDKLKGKLKDKIEGQHKDE